MSFFSRLFGKKNAGTDDKRSSNVNDLVRKAEKGDMEAQFSLGVMYENGYGVERSPEEAVKWYRKAAEQGKTEAQFDLGWLYSNGEGVERSDSEAAKWYRKAAD